MIIVINRTQYPKGELPEPRQYIGKPRSLANPYAPNAVKDGAYGAVELYRKDLFNVIRTHGETTLSQFKDPQATYQAFLDLIEKVRAADRSGGNFYLECSCVTADIPEDQLSESPCHGITLSKALRWYIENHPEPVPPTPVSVKPLQIGERVRHTDPRVVDRSPGQYAYKITDKDRPRRVGTIIMTSASHPWDCVPGMVKVAWDDLVNGVLEHAHPFKYGHETYIMPDPDAIPERLLERVELEVIQ